jgi:hypothetical protein
MPTGPRPEDPMVRFLRNVEFTETCWIFHGSIRKDGYGRFGVGSRIDGTKRVETAHSWFWKAVMGDYSPCMTLDHVKDRGCTSRACVCLFHLEVVTRGENVRRGDAGRHARDKRGRWRAS